MPARDSSADRQANDAEETEVYAVEARSNGGSSSSKKAGDQRLSLGLNAGCTVLFSLPFIGAGLFAIGNGAGFWGGMESGENGGGWPLILFGLVFAGAGAGVFIWGFRQLRAAIKGGPGLRDHLGSHTTLETPDGGHRATTLYRREAGESYPWTAVGSQSRRDMPMGVKFSLLFGLPFLFAGSFLLFAGLSGRLTSDDGKAAPLVVLVPMGLIFGGVGAFFVGFGVLTFIRKWRRKAALARGERVWIVDYAWDRRGARAQRPSILKGALGLVAFGVFLTPFNAGVFGGVAGGSVPFFAKLVVGLFDLVYAAMIVKALQYAARQTGKRLPRLRFTTFPFFLGESLRVVLVPGGRRATAATEPLSATLRCVEERIVTRTTRSSSSTSSTSSISVGTRYVDRCELTPTGSGLPIEFELPADAPETALAAHPPRYWEIAIEPQADAETANAAQENRLRRPRRRGAKSALEAYAGTFLVPVYQKR